MVSDSIIIWENLRSPQNIDFPEAGDYLFFFPSEEESGRNGPLRGL